MKHYILKDRKIEVVEDLMTWAKWFEKSNDRIIKQTMIGKTRVSTVFLGLDHSFGGPVPILFETMIFGNKKYDGWQRRYATIEEAELGHEDACKMIRRNK